MGEPKPVTAEDVERLRGWLDNNRWRVADKFRILFAMVRSVLEIHKPMDSGSYTACESCVCLSDDGYQDWPCPTVAALVGCLAFGWPPVTDEPRDVRVARALKLHNVRQWPEIAKAWGTPWVYTSDDGARPVPDYTLDPAWVIRTIEANLLDVIVQQGPVIHPWLVKGALKYGSGKSIGEALVSWVIAAAEAGVEVRQ